MVDQIGRGLASLAAKVIKEGRYYDIKGRWTDIIKQFLFPSDPPLLLPRVGWAIYPRDGQDEKQLLCRAVYHLKELNR